MKFITTDYFWCSLGFGYLMSSILVGVVNHATKQNTENGGWLAWNNINTHVDFFFWDTF